MMPSLSFVCCRFLHPEFDPKLAALAVGCIPAGIVSADDVDMVYGRNWECYASSIHFYFEILL